VATVYSYTLKSGETRYRVQYRDPEGYQQTKSGFATKRDANAFRVKTENAKLDGTYVSPSRGRVTVGSLGAQWLQIKKATMKKEGYRSYESAWRIHVEPRWGDIPIGKIEQLAVELWIAFLTTEQGLGAKSVHRCHGVLHGILETAVRNRMLSFNPASGAALPKARKLRPIFLAHEQLEAFICEAGNGKSTARKDGPAIVAVLGYCGLRWGELAALTPEALIRNGKRFFIDRNAVRGGDDDPSDDDSAKGDDRTVPIPNRVMKLLQPILDATPPGERLFRSARGGVMRPPGNNTWWSAAVARCQKADPTFPKLSAHKLRHTAISLAIASGGSVLAVQRVAGHTSITMTYDRYGHILPDDLDLVAENMDRAAELVTGERYVEEKYNKNATPSRNRGKSRKAETDTVIEKQCQTSGQH
jgi:integrase